VKALHFVPSAGVDGAYGGPVAVCETLASTISQRGHEVVVVTTDGGVRTRRDVSWAPFSYVTFKGWFLCWRRTPKLIFSVSLLVWLYRHVRKFDVVHVHSGREPLGFCVVFVARMKQRPVVLQTHGMLERHDGARRRIVDRTLGRLLFRQLRHIFALTKHEQSHRIRSREPVS
jgi:glycosyltransferase involved in cell wall biosynthesis